MLRPLPPQPNLETDESGPYGLASALEPEDDELETCVGPMSVRSSALRTRAPHSVRSAPLSVRSAPHSVRSAPHSVRSAPSSVRSAPHSTRSPHGTLAPVSVRSAHAQVAPVQVQDFAFADTVFARELEEPAPSSGPIFVNDPIGASSPQLVTPLAFPMPDPQQMQMAAEVDLAARLKHSVRGTILEMREAWEATAFTTVDASEPPPSPASFFVRRVVAMCSSWQWDRADVVRAAVIGTAVFVVAAAIGAVAVQSSPSAASADAEVRARHTLEQHTGRAIVVHAKATR